MQNSDACRPNIGATHVITEIQYGFNAYLIFEKKVGIDESKEHIGGRLKVSVKTMGVEIGGGEASVNIVDEYQQEFLNATFIFHGDTIIGMVHFNPFFISFVASKPKGLLMS